MKQNKKQDIRDFRKRLETEREFCLELFRETTIKVLAAKHAYYVLNNPYLDDLGYDLMEYNWYVMGRALELVEQDEHTPCVDFDESHPLAKEAIELSQRLRRK